MLKNQVILVLDVPNANNRMYSSEVMSEAIKRWADKDMFGTFSDDAAGGSGVDLSLVTHIVRDLRVEDGKLLGNIHILDTPKGRILQAVLNGGTEVAYRPVGSGNTVDGVIKDYELWSVSSMLASEAA